MSDAFTGPTELARARTEHDERAGGEALETRSMTRIPAGLRGDPGAAATASRLAEVAERERLLTGAA